MFDSSEFPASLDEALFESWLEKGRQSPITYEFMLVIWDETLDQYSPVYAEDRKDIAEKNPGFWGETYGHTATVAIYDLFSEAKLSLNAFQQ